MIQVNDKIYLKFHHLMDTVTFKARVVKIGEYKGVKAVWVVIPKNIKNMLWCPKDWKDNKRIIFAYDKAVKCLVK